MTELMQASRQWSSRAPDERFTSLLDMQALSTGSEKPVAPTCSAAAR